MANYGQLDELTVFTNKFLDRVTAWEETKVPGYKKQMFLIYSHPWLVALLIFLLFNTAFSLAGALIALPFVWLPVEYQGIAYTGLALIVMGIIAIIIGKRKAVKAIEKYNGEIGHKGKPFASRAVVCLFFGLVLALAACVGFTLLLYYMYLDSIEGASGDILSISLTYIRDLANFTVGFFYPFFYSIGVMVGISKMRHASTCPVCGRYSAIYYYSMGEFGKAKGGNYDKDITVRARVGTRYTTTTTTWSDGSKTSNTTSEPIYGQVYDHTDVHEYGTLMERFAMSCKGCSYHREFTDERQYDEVIGRKKVR